MNYVIARDGSQLGGFSDTEIPVKLASGELRATDLGWCEGMADWTPLSALFETSSSSNVGGAPPPLPVKKDIGDDVGMRMILPVGRSGWAIAAGYLGLFGLVVVPAPFALIVSIIAILDIQKSKKTGKRKHGMGRAIFGLIVGLLGTGLLFFVLISGMMGSKAE